MIAPQDGTTVRASSRMRPQSQSSTTSVHSATTQPNLDTTMDHSGFADGRDMYTNQWAPPHPGQHHDMNAGRPPMSPGELLFHNAQHIQASAHNYPMGDTLGAAVGAPMDPRQMSFHSHHGSLPNEDGSRMADHMDEDSHMMDQDDRNGWDGSIQGVKSTKSGKSNANNEHEMRQLFMQNRGRTLEEVASELHGDERGPNSERTRQLYAMLWLQSACVLGKGSVPRSRVYHTYATRCTDDRVVVLNPASFGKLVRVLFPGLKTRRLGVRGESKYHYVNFELREQPREDKPEPTQTAQPPQNEKRGSFNFNTPPAQQPNRTINGQLPSPTEAVNPHQNLQTSPAQRMILHSRYNTKNQSEARDADVMSAKTPLELVFMSRKDQQFDSNEPLVLPPILSFLPPGTDQDAALSLTALYRSHCTSLVESLRFCKEKNFFHLYTSFHGTLTMPVQRLFANPSVAPWIEQCDIILYQRLSRVVCPLALQVIPKPVLDIMRKVSETLVKHIREAFQGQPEHVIRAKERPATIFAGVLDRMLRVNLTAHAAANSMSNTANRDQMFEEWVRLIQPRRIAECVPTRGMDDVAELLVSEMRSIVDPVNVAPETEHLLAEQQGTRQEALTSSGKSSAFPGQYCLDRVETLLMSLPERFPYASHTDIAWCVERVGTAIMRDLTLASSSSFSSWWVLKMFIDEEVSYLAELGGFLKTKTIREPRSAARPTTSAAGDDGEKGRVTGNDKEREVNGPPVPAPASPGHSDRAPFPPKQPEPQAPADMTGVEMHEDSGIGICTPETDFHMDKFQFVGPDQTDMDTRRPIELS